MKSSNTPSAVRHIVIILINVKKIIFADHSHDVNVANGNMKSELQAKRGPISCLGGNFKTRCLVKAEPAAVEIAAKRARIVGSIWKRYRKISCLKEWVCQDLLGQKIWVKEFVRVTG